MGRTELLKKLLPGFIPLFEFVRQKRQQKLLAKEEWVPWVDESGNIKGQMPRSKAHDGSKRLHPVVHLHVFNGKKAILLQKRPASKLIQPGKWDTAVGGHISAGETPEEALKKEAEEEMGMRGFSARLLKVYKWESAEEAELIHLFVTHDSKKHVPDSEEVDEARFWTPRQIEKQLGKGVFTPNFEHEFGFLKNQGLL